MTTPGWILVGFCPSTVALFAHSPNVRRTLFWQGLLVLAPVALLAGVGWYALRQDRLAAQNEGRERAQRVAEEVARGVWGELTNPAAGWLGPVRLVLGPTGELVWPLPREGPPLPSPLDLQGLEEHQRALWDAADAFAYRNASDAEAAERFQSFLHSGPPERFAGIALYRMALGLTKAGRSREALTALSQVFTLYPQVITEAGLPLSQMAGVKFLELVAGTEANGEPAKPALSFDAVCAAVVESPNLMTPHWLERLSGLAAREGERQALARWQAQWRSDEVARELYRSSLREGLENGPPRARSLSRDSGVLPLVWWVDGPTGTDGRYDPSSSERWLLFGGEETSTSRVYSCQSQLQLDRRFGAWIGRAVRLPEYFTASLEIGGENVGSGAGGGAGGERAERLTPTAGSLGGEGRSERAFPVLASVGWPKPGAEAVRIQVFLTSPELLYRAQRTRRFWFGLLIGAAAVAAMSGVVALSRALARQERLNELKSNFVSSVSHELRAPIASVRLMAESLEAGKVAEPAKQREYFAFISRECRRLSSLIENVLDFSRIEQGRKQYDWEPTDLRSLAATTQKLMEPYAAERGLTLRLKAGGEGKMEAMADGKSLQQALVNLIDNALKHSPRGGTVTVGLDRGAGAAGAVFRLWVEDEGPGIPAEEHARIFERFYRCGSELRRQTQGAGIGLSIVRHIVEAHGGAVHVRSAPGQGSRFTMELPEPGSEVELDHA